MKLKLNKYLGLAMCTFMIIASLSSCLKDRNYSATDFSQVKNVVDLPVNGFQAIALNINV